MPSRTLPSLTESQRIEVGLAYHKPLFGALIGYVGKVKCLQGRIGFNQVAPTFIGAYGQLRRQDLVALTVSIPLIDWGVRKGKVNMARTSGRFQAYCVRLLCQV